MFSTGRSGLFFSPLYRNLAEPWRRVEDLPLWAGEKRHELVLEPAGRD